MVAFGSIFVDLNNMRCFLICFLHAAAHLLVPRGHPQCLSMTDGPWQITRVPRMQPRPNTYHAAILAGSCSTEISKKNNPSLLGDSVLVDGKTPDHLHSPHKTVATPETTSDISNVRTAGDGETGGGSFEGRCKSRSILGGAPRIQTKNCVDFCVDFFGPNSQRFSVSFYHNKFH